MELIYAIADYLGIPNEFVVVEKAQGDLIWFRTKAGAQYTCRTVRNGKYLKAHSVRTARY